MNVDSSFERRFKLQNVDIRLEDIMSFKLISYVSYRYIDI